MDNTIYQESRQAAEELIRLSALEAGGLLVIGCSTSEVLGEKIGSASKPEVAQEVFRGIWDAAQAHGIYLAAQCCEHLNRALILEKEAAQIRNLEQVNVIPQPKAGGSFATAAFEHFQQPVAVEHVAADAGMDIGDTLIGMHLKEVAVPVRLSVKSIGCARVVCARTRPKFIGGQRAIYNSDLL